MIGNTVPAFTLSHRAIGIFFSSEHVRVSELLIFKKGGDPGAPSGTPTLLRLRPSHQPHPRRLLPFRVRIPASGVASSHDVTGGVYKARERIHRSIADLRLLATPASYRRVAACNLN